MNKRNVLGKGLGALIEMNNDTPLASGPIASINEIELSQIEPNPYQPRLQFNNEGIEELAASIKELGIIQPITLRKLSDKAYQIIAGERRVRAAKLAGLQKVPAYVRAEIDNNEMLEMALVENIQREELNAIEIALSYQRLIEECKLTQERLSERVGKSRPAIANYIRLLKLPAAIQLSLQQGIITMGHARALLSIENLETQMIVFEEVVEKGLSVRDTESLSGLKSKYEYNWPEQDEFKEVNRLFQEEQAAAKQRYNAIKDQLNQLLNTKVKLAANQNGVGKITIYFDSEEHLNELAQQLNLKQP